MSRSKSRTCDNCRMLLSGIQFSRLLPTRVEEQVEFLQRELIWMQSFLKVADDRKADNEVVRTSVAKIRELAYDAKDVIETFALKVASKRK
ncbi:hypothetical protein CRYUN_Cryun01aG0080400 [Craigia yunnanensis]